MKKVLISLSQPPVEIVKDADDPMDVLIKCPYCGTLTTVGNTLMISGFVGCDRCYFVPGGLLETTLFVREHEYENYREGRFYKDGFFTNKRKAEIRNDSKD
jgi:hypothetical protein